MKRLLLHVTFLALFITPSLLGLKAQNTCDGSLWKFVYHPQRFTVWKQCTSVTGTIMAIKPEADGDLHIQLKLDKGQPRFLNQRNMVGQKGCLVLEIICKGNITQADAKQPCKGCPKNVNVPKIGDHVKVTGTFVKDNDANHGWNEIHPVYSIENL